jgi:hypothetical protein
MSTVSDVAIRELDCRNGDGMVVRLMWDSRTDRVLLRVDDDRLGESFEFRVAGADALDAFHHPYAYVYREHVDQAIAA